MPQTYTKPPPGVPQEAPTTPGVFTPAVPPRPMPVSGREQGVGNGFTPVGGIELFTPSFEALTSGSTTGEVQQTTATVPVAAVVPRNPADAPPAADGVTALTLISVGAAMKFGGAIITGLATLVTAKQAVSGFIGWVREALSDEEKNKAARLNELINPSVDKVTAPQCTDVFVGDPNSDKMIRKTITQAVQGGQSSTLPPPHVLVIGENGVKGDVAEDIAARLKVPLITVDCANLAGKSIVMKDFISRLEKEVLPDRHPVVRWCLKLLRWLGWPRKARTEAVLSLIGHEQLVDKKREVAASLLDGIRGSPRLEASAMLVVTTEPVHKQNVQQLLLTPLEVTIPSPATAEMTAKLLQEKLPRPALSDAEALRVSQVFGAKLLTDTTLRVLKDLNSEYNRRSKILTYDLLIPRILDSCYKERNTGHLTEENSNLHKEVAIAESLVASALGIPVVGFSAQAESMDKLVYRSRLSQTSSVITDPEVVMKELVIELVRQQVQCQTEFPNASKLSESIGALKLLAPQVHKALEVIFTMHRHSDLAQFEFDHAVQAVMERARSVAEKITETLPLSRTLAALDVRTAHIAPELLGSAFDTFLEPYRDSLSSIESEFKEFFTKVTKMVDKSS